MNKKCTFIILYFGKLPNYFNLFLRSCKYNSDYMWIVFTDDDAEYEWPSNVMRVLMTFEELKQKIQSKFDFEIKIGEPHKLCDYKPAYGYIFEDFIGNSAYWGHCDIDIILGNMNKFLDDLLTQGYNKLFCLGHMELYQNTYENNRTFMLPVSGEYWYKESFTSNKTTVFDETGSGTKNINVIFKAYNKGIYEKDLSMNCSIVPTQLVKVTYYADEERFLTEKKKDALYIFDEGNLFRLYIAPKKDGIKREDFLYIHLQLRKMKISKELTSQNRFKILENSFTQIENIYSGERIYISVHEFNKIKRHAFSLRYFKMQIKWKKAKIEKKWKRIIDKWKKDL